MKTLKETIKEMEELGLVVERVIFSGWDKNNNFTHKEIQFKKETKQ